MKKKKERKKRKQLKDDLKRLEKLQKETKEKQEAQKIKDQIKKAKEQTAAEKLLLEKQIKDLKEVEAEGAAMKKHKEIRDKQRREKQKWEDLKEDRINQNITEDEAELEEQINQTFYGVNNERPYYPFFMDPLQKGWSEKKNYG